MLKIFERYVSEKIIEDPPAQRIDCFLSPYYGWVIERLVDAIKPDTSSGEVAELPITEKGKRELGSSADVSFWTSRAVREAVNSHVNFIVADTDRWEQSASYLIDAHKITGAFVKNAGLGFAIPYLHNGEPHDFEPDFIVRLDGSTDRYLIIETKGHDPLAEVKQQAASRWVSAVNQANRFGHWQFAMCRSVGEVRRVLDKIYDSGGSMPT
jgi:type III restriction enzyme